MCCALAQARETFVRKVPIPRMGVVGFPAKISLLPLKMHACPDARHSGDEVRERQRGVYPSGRYGQLAAWRQGDTSLFNGLYPYSRLNFWLKIRFYQIT